MVGGGGGGTAVYCSSGWQLWVVLVKNFQNFVFDPNELKSPKKQHVFLLFFSIKGGESSIIFFLNPSLKLHNTYFHIIEMFIFAKPNINSYL